MKNMLIKSSMSVVVATVLIGCGGGGGGGSDTSSELNNSKNNFVTTESQDDFPPNPPAEMTGENEIPATDNNGSDVEKKKDYDSNQIVAQDPPPSPPPNMGSDIPSVDNSSMTKNEELSHSSKVISFNSNQFILGDDEVSISEGSFTDVILENNNSLSTVSFALENLNNNQFETNLTLKLIPVEENGSLNFDDFVILGLTQLNVEGNNLTETEASKIKAYTQNSSINKDLKSGIIINDENQTSISLTKIFDEIQLDNSKQLSDYLKSGNKYQIIVGFSNLDEFKDGINVKDKILEGLNKDSDFALNIENMLSNETKGFYGNFQIQ